MNKRALMLTAATVALLSAPTLADTTFTTEQTSSQSTSSDGTITITSTGSIVISTNPPTAPAVTINGGTTPGTAADVLNLGSIKYAGIGSATSPVTGIELVTGNTGGIDNGSSGIIDMTGAGTNKTGILISGPPGSLNSGTFLGNITATSGTNSPPCPNTSQPCINGGVALSTLTGIPDTNAAAILLESSSKLQIQGDNSFGINLVSGTSLGNTATPSDIDILGNLTMTPSSSTSTASAANAIYIAGTLTGNINIASGGVINVQGNSSNGINLIAANSQTSTPGGVINGNINIDGTLAMTPISTTSTTSTGNIALNLAGALNGNFDIGTAGAVSSTGQGAVGLQLYGPMTGFIENQGVLETIGTSTPSSNGGNPEAGSAMVIAASVGGGIYNAGPANTTDTSTTLATIATLGNASTVVFNPQLPVNGTTVTTPVELDVGLYTDPAGLFPNASFINRGKITDQAVDADNSVTTVDIVGASSSAVTKFLGGFYNGGTITAAAVTDTKASLVSATALYIGDYATIPFLNNSVEQGANPGAAGSGTISSQVTGAEGGTAYAIFIHSTSNASGIFGSLSEIDNNGTILATAQSTNTQLVGGALKAYAIDDQSGTLQTIKNSGTIEAFATTLSDNSQVAQALNLANGTKHIDIENSGTIVGDILTGSGSTTLDVSGAASAPASVTGNIYFGGTVDANPAGDDILNIGAHGTVTGYVTEAAGSVVDVTVQNGGTLSLKAAPVVGTSTTVIKGVSLNAGSLLVANGGTLDIAVSQGFNTGVPTFAGNSLINAKTSAEIDLGAVVNLTYGSFLSSPNGQPATFALIATPGAFTMPGGELQAIINNTAIPFLYTGGVCTWNINGATTCAGSNPIPGDEVLGLALSPKGIGPTGCQTATSLNCNPDLIPLAGYAAKIFPYANVALGTDNALGGAMISSIQNATEAQAAYENFAPDVSGATRALAISLTDEATNVVADRQRVLREYANQEGDTTLWAQQFVQRLNQQGATNTGPGYADSGFGFALGMDDGDAIDGRYGGAFTFFTGDAREKSPRTTKTTSEWFMLTGYTDWRGKGLFLDTQATVGYANFKGDRRLILNLPDGTIYSRLATTQRPGEYLAGGVTTGVIFNENGTVFTPQISLDGLAMREESYNEQGGGDGFNLKVNSSYLNSLRAFTGVDIRQDLNFGDFLLQPDLRGGFRYDFANGAESLHTQFESVQPGPGTVFNISGPKPDKGNVVAGGGLAVSTGAWSIGVGFDYLRAGSGNTSEEGTLTLLGRI